MARYALGTTVSHDTLPWVTVAINVARSFLLGLLTTVGTGLAPEVRTALGIGAALILGLASRGAALVGLGQQLFLAAVYFSSNRWMFEQPHEYVPLFILAVVPAGRVWGLCRRRLNTGPPAPV